ncbi:unnamed protein product [Rotaria sordida]|uniref:Uncharacterized protein n=1 Tax=Rotaria sordida TaxID=392033 RepID=A0A814G036_9BILA|nr:unnamed protein product [Rotaria sordida]CAF3727014.1 unnamed protein product [Rotaria sordida]
MEGEKKRDGRRISIIREFALNTSTHALPGIARSESIHNRVFWSISFISFTAIMIYFVVEAILAYFEYPTQMNVSYNSEWPQYFPAFSLCNASPFRFDRFIEPFLNFTNTHNLTNTNDTTTLSALQASYLWNFIVDRINRNESMEPFFYSLSSMLYTCTFNSQPCSAADFISFTSSTYGLCYTFNAKLKNSSNDSVRYGHENGGTGKLNLGLYVHSHQYVPHIEDSIGMVVQVHDNTQLPRIEAAGIELSTGRKHKLSYTKKTVYFPSSPYTACTDKLSLSMKLMFDNYNGADYGYLGLICYENQYCFECSDQCSIIDFLVQASSLIAPVPWQMDDIKRFVENSTIPLPENWSTTWHEHIHANYLAVDVVRETNIVENNTQTPTLTPVDVLSNIGGQTGLWIGISFLSIMEVIEMFYRLIRYECNVVQRAKQRKQQIVPK